MYCPTGSTQPSGSRRAALCSRTPTHVGWSTPTCHPRLRAALPPPVVAFHQGSPRTEKGLPMPELIFPLDEVLVLAEHAAVAASNAPPVAGEPPGPALLLAAADGIYLLSNGLPQLDAAPGQPGQPHAYGIRAVYADGYSPGTPAAARDTATGTRGEVLTGIPVPAQVLRRLRANADTHDVFTLTLTASHALLGVARRHPGGARGETQPPTGG